MKAIELHLLRHGAPETPGLLMGRTDGLPTPAGIAACVEQATGLGVEAVVASDLARAARAADAVGERLGLPVTIDPRWRELDFGDWDGLAPSAIDGRALALFWNDPEEHGPPNGERWSSLVARVAVAIADLDCASTLVVTHGGAIRAVLAHLCGFAHAQIWAIDLPYGALLSLRIWPGASPSAQIVALRP